MSLNMIFEDKQATGLDKLIQAVAWPQIRSKSNNDDTSELITSNTKLVAIGTSKGIVKLIDLKKNKVIWKASLNHIILDLDFNSQNMLAVATHNRELHLIQYSNDMKMLPSAYLGDGLRCLHFSSLDPSLLAIGLQDGTIVIFDV